MRIVFIPFPEAGHLNASFKLARGLKVRGHQVCYLGVQDFEESVLWQRFEFVPVFEDAIRRGFMSQETASKGIEPFEALLLAAKSGSRPFDPLAELERKIRKIRPDLLIIDLLLSGVALMARSMEMPAIFLNTQFYDPWEDPLKATIYKSLLDVPELVLCPREFDFPRSKTRENCYYVEASIDHERIEPPFPWHKLSSNKPLIYCSLGSQGHLIKGNRQILQTVIDAVSAKSDLQLVLATGAHLSPDDFGAVPLNVILVDKAPQLNLLKRTSIVITHGGFNTVKECIYFGVPMIVVPLIRDHPAVAARVAHYGLGLRCNIHNMTVERVQSLIDQIDENPSFRKRCRQMGERFRELEAAEGAVGIVESILTRFSNECSESRSN